MEEFVDLSASVPVGGLRVQSPCPAKCHVTGPSSAERANPMDETDYENAASCPVCGGDGQLLGQLGNLTHFRCRACGMDFNQHVSENPSDLIPEGEEVACDVIGNPAEFHEFSGHLKGGGGTDYCTKCHQLRYVTFGRCGKCIAQEVAVSKQAYIQTLIDRGMSLRDAEQMARNMEDRHGPNSREYWRSQKPYGESSSERGNPRYRIGDHIRFLGPRVDARDPPVGSIGVCSAIAVPGGKKTCHPDPYGRMVFAEWLEFGPSSVWVRATERCKNKSFANPSLMLITGNPPEKSVKKAWERFHQADFRGPVETMASIHGVPEILFAVGKLVSLEVGRKLQPRGGTIWVACSPDDQGLWLLAKSDVMDLNGSQGDPVKALTYDPPQHSGKEKDAVFRHEFKKPHPVLAPVGHANRCRAALLEGGVYTVDDWLYD